ncbi:MAG: hypothetical protein F6J90_04265 [Moorea sp. SIOASIH]|uniref:hypothetical protein n=1 Tax=Moorena sp. SIOASIH TaxID=2607817 RepID=UPI0013BB8985|nr:hypothetical protein [Moorena sp. SIOASIH]NEO35570.1 hypothetical protein [Moorena sp. SIOASIH]
MNRLVSALLVSSTLFLAQSCSTPVQSGDASVEGDKHHGHHNHNEHGHHHGSHGHGNKPSVKTKAILTTPSTITLDKPNNLVIDIQDSEGNAVPDFEVFQEKIMHLIVVSDDLDFYDHIHPDYKGNGRFEVEANFPKPGNYTLFSDYKPTGNPERVSVLKVKAPGTSSSLNDREIKNTKVFGKTKVELSFDKPKVQANEEVMISFNLKDAANNNPVNDLQPYLGEVGHLVIVKKSESITASDYIHAHALPGKTTEPIRFATQFPETGTYKVWGQFKRNGEIVTADFWVNAL